MANCSACSSIKTMLPDIESGGITEETIKSIAKNTGLNPSLSHENKDDMKLLIECLIENLANNINSADHNNWKDIMQSIVANLSGVLQLLVAWSGGIEERKNKLETIED